MEYRLLTRLGTLQLQIDSLKKYQIPNLLPDVTQNPSNSTPKDIELALQSKYRIRNVLNEMLGTVRALKYHTENVILAKIKEMKRHLLQIDKGKLPDYQDQIPISNESYVATTDEVASLRLGMPCERYEIPESQVIATPETAWFWHTDSTLFAHYKNQEFLECTVRLLRSTKAYYLELKIKVNSLKSERVLGYLDPNAPARIDFMNGHYIYLQAFAQTDIKRIPAENQTVYQVQYQLDQEDLSQLSKYDTEFISLVWTRGATQYELFQMDLIKNLLACLRAKN